jgi:hypothetical protein
MSDLSDIEGSVSAIRTLEEDGVRHRAISRILAGTIDYSTPEGKVMGSRRALFCSRLSHERLWPERK